MAPITRDELTEMVELVNPERGIAAISFIGDKLTNSEDVNQLFTMPYMSTTIMQGINNTNNSKMLKDAKTESIISYYKMNCNSLAYEHFLNILQKAFVVSDDINVATMIGGILSLNDYSMANIIWCSNMYCIGNLVDGIDDEYQNYSITDIIRYLTPIVDITFSNIVEEYNRFLADVIDNSLKSGKFETIFNMIFTSSYGEAPTAQQKSDIRVMVGFITAYVRNIMEDELPRLRMALDLVATTVACMIKDQPMISLEKRCDAKCLEEIH